MNFPNIFNWVKYCQNLFQNNYLGNKIFPWEIEEDLWWTILVFKISLNLPNTRLNRVKPFQFWAIYLLHYSYIVMKLNKHIAYEDFDQHARKGCIGKGKFEKHQWENKEVKCSLYKNFLSYLQDKNFDSNNCFYSIDEKNSFYWFILSFILIIQNEE
jgi:hypothetical protein